MRKYKDESWYKIAKFWSQVDVGSINECWPYTGYRNQKGYGITGGNKKAHRVACEISGRPIPVDKLGLHHCDNPPCCNPRHIYAGTHLDNVRDMLSRGRGNKAIGDRNGNYKIPDSVVLEIRRSADMGTVLAERYGISVSSVSLIRRNKLRKTVANQS